MDALFTAFHFTDTHLEPLYDKDQARAFPILFFGSIWLIGMGSGVMVGVLWGVGTGIVVRVQQPYHPPTQPTNHTQVVKGSCRNPDCCKRGKNLCDAFTYSELEPPTLGYVS